MEPCAGTVELLIGNIGETFPPAGILFTNKLPGPADGVEPPVQILRSIGTEYGAKIIALPGENQSVFL